jgi:hypothetical protein
LITFPHGETFKQVRVELTKPDPIEEQKETKKVEDDSEDVDRKKSDSEEESSDEEQDLQFKIKLSDPKPEGAKISQNKKLCIVTISGAENFEQEQDIQAKLLEIYLAEKKPNWGKQFVDACVLGP